MKWDKHESTLFFESGKIPVDMDSPPAVGDTARITKDGYEFDVKIKANSGADLSGVVIRIGPLPAIEAMGINRDDAVNFRVNHIHTLYRA